ncbi:MAG: hypothetical protein EA356_14730 [Geminicoccaceae bacterium]|nr:MAG: hypothetical protein EA356_14730 [Geminicoccaceae bacterium]
MAEAPLVDLAARLGLSPNAVQPGAETSAGGRTAVVTYPSFFVTEPHVFAALVQAALSVEGPVRLVLEQDTAHGPLTREFVPEPSAAALAELEAVDPPLGQGLRRLFDDLDDRYGDRR